MAQHTTIGLFIPSLGGYYFGSIMQGRSPGRARLIAIQGVPAAVRAPSFAWDQVDGWLVVQRIDGIEAIAERGKPIVRVHKRITSPSIAGD